MADHLRGQEVVMIPNECGYFDNGFDQEHEHRHNCRKCLMDRIADLTAQIAAPKLCTEELFVDRFNRPEACGLLESNPIHHNSRFALMHAFKAK